MWASAPDNKKQMISKQIRQRHRLALRANLARIPTASETAGELPLLVCSICLGDVTHKGRSDTEQNEPMINGCAVCESLDRPAGVCMGSCPISSTPPGQRNIIPINLLHTIVGPRASKKPSDPCLGPQQQNEENGNRFVRRIRRSTTNQRPDGLANGDCVIQPGTRVL